MNSLASKVTLNGKLTIAKRHLKFIFQVDAGHFTQQGEEDCLAASSEAQIFSSSLAT